MSEKSERAGGGIGIQNQLLPTSWVNLTRNVLGTSYKSLCDPYPPL